jgi:hypothetical protein
MTGAEDILTLRCRLRRLLEHGAEGDGDPKTQLDSAWLAVAAVA